MKKISSISSDVLFYAIPYDLIINIPSNRTEVVKSSQTGAKQTQRRKLDKTGNF